MQNELSSRIEKIWAMADIALRQGAVDYGIDGHCKIVRLAGMKLKFIDGVLSRVLAPQMDIGIQHLAPQTGVTFFPGAQTIVQFLKGDDQLLGRLFSELNALEQVFSVKAA